MYCKLKCLNLCSWIEITSFISVINLYFSEIEASENQSAIRENACKCCFLTCYSILSLKGVYYGRDQQTGRYSCG